ncbi:hypothetical protein E4U16_005786 [Claviceps sp. LM84 group G4]|nr:hypothetical protein E4U16_005786 [Claviceps sp. LM84 group G4]
MSAGRGSAVGVDRPLSQSRHRFLPLDSRKIDQQANSQKRKGAEMEAAVAKKTKSWTPVGQAGGLGLTVASLRTA